MNLNGVGILTGGGDCPGLNAVIRIVVKAAQREHGARTIGFMDGFAGLVENRHRVLTPGDVSGLASVGGTILGTSNKANPFSHPILRGGETVREDLSDWAITNFRNLELDALVVVGGDGTQSIANRLHLKGLPVVGVPKTIDNDLAGTDRTFGFNSAVQRVTEALDNIHTTAMSHHRVMVVEVMGRYAGWIALAGGVAGGGDVILIPEIPYKLEKVAEVIEKRADWGRRFTIVVIAEGAKPKGGEMTISRTVDDSPDPVRLGGCGVVLANQIEDLTGVESRAVILGHLQRGGSPTAFDRNLATRYGHAALRYAAEGKFGHMVALRGTEMLPVPLSEAVDHLRLVPSDHPLVQAARAGGVSFGD
jgi:6-phosphofructokinase 1